jgi:hypothetical protein
MSGSFSGRGFAAAGSVADASVDAGGAVFFASREQAVIRRTRNAARIRDNVNS